jgi:hypothetical protein
MSQSLPYKTAAANTSLGRFLNPATWLPAFRMPLRLHIWTDGSSVRTAVYFQGRWTQGPDIDYQETKEGDILAVHVREIAERGYGGKRVSGIGVILHVADELATCPLRDEFLEESELRYAQTAILTEPQTIVDDIASPEENVWRILPLARKQTLAIRLSAERGRILANLRSALATMSKRSRHRTPIRVAMVSSPLVAISTLPIYYRPDNAATSRTHILCLVYPRFTTITVIDGAGDVVEFNALSHGVRSNPQGFAQRVQNHITKYGTETEQRTNLTLVQMGRNDLQPFIEDIRHQAAGAAEVFRDVRIEVINEEELREISVQRNLPGAEWFCPEFCAYDLPVDAATCRMSCINQEAFAQIRAAAEANFYTPQIMADKASFSKGESLAFLLLGWWNWLAAIVLLILAAISGFSAMMAIRSPAWKLNQEKAAEVEQIRQRILATNASLESWREIMRPRSHGWEAMEFLHRLFPDSAPVVLRKMRLEIRGLAPDQSGETTPAKIGFLRNWSFEGLAGSDGLSSIEAEAIAESYQSVADGQADSTYQLENRRLTMDIKQERMPVDLVNRMPMETKWQAVISDRIEEASGHAMPLKMMPLPQLDEATIAGWENLILNQP